MSLYFVLSSQIDSRYKQTLGLWK